MEVDGAGSCPIDSSLYLSPNGGTTGECIAVYNNGDVSATASYACAKMHFNGSNTDGVYGGVCLAMDTTGDNNVCCEAAMDTFDWFTWETIATVFNDTNRGPGPWADTNFVGIERYNPTDFRCFKATGGGTSWSAMTSTYTLGGGLPNPGKAGLWMIGNSPPSIEIDQWEFGPGTLPTGHTCGQ